MSGYTTGFEKRYAEYKAALEKVAGDKIGPELKEFMSAMGELNVLTTSDSFKDLIGDSQKKMLMESYKKLIQTADVFLRKDSPSRLDKRLGTVVGEMKRLALQDMNFFEKLPIDLSYRDAIAEARKDTLDITGQRLASQGGALSSRVPIAYLDANGRMVKGFFTKGSRIETMPTVLMTHHQKFTEKGGLFQRFGDVIFDFYERKGSSYDTNNFNINVGALTLSKDPKELEKTWILFQQTLKIAELPSDIAEQIKTNPQDFSELVSMLMDMAKDVVMASTYGEFTPELETGLNASAGSSIDQRNCAMSSIARLVGMDGTLAKSHVVTIANQGQLTEGVFMETVSGSDVNALYEGDPLMAWGTQELLISPTAVCQLADMQALDYICGNVDRHVGNMFYQFDSTDHEHPVLTGITGIDNDASFSKDMLLSGQIQNSIPLDRLKVMTQSMAEKVLALNPDTIALALASYQLSAEEKAAASKRLELLQSAVKYSMNPQRGPEDLEKGQTLLEIVPDQELTYEKAKAASNGAKNLFRRLEMNLVHDINVHAKQIKDGLDTLPKKPSEPQYAGAVLGQTQSPKADREAVAQKLETLCTKLKGADRLLHKNTDEYKLLVAATEKVLNTMRDPGSADSDVIEDLESLKTIAQEYITSKPTIPKTEMGQQRLSFARDLRDLADDTGVKLVAQKAGPKPTAKTFTESGIERFKTEIAKRSAVISSGASIDIRNQALAETIYLKNVQERFAKNPVPALLTEISSASVEAAGIKIAASPEFVQMLAKSGPQPLQAQAPSLPEGPAPSQPETPALQQPQIQMKR